MHQKWTTHQKWFLIMIILCNVMHCNTAHATHDTLADILNSYTIKDAVKNIGEAWSQVTSKNMRGVWNKLLQRTNQEPHEPPVEEIVEDIVNLGHELNLELEKEDIKEGLGFDNKDLSNEDLYEMAQPGAYEEDKEKPEEKVAADRPFTTEFDDGWP